MPDPRSIDAWMRWESERLNEGLVTRPRSLRALLEDDTALRTRDGTVYPIDPHVLVGLAAACTLEERSRLRLPVTLHFSVDVEDSAYVIDGLAAEILHRLEGWRDAYPYRDGKMWLPRSLALDLLLRYGGVLQPLAL